MQICPSILEYKAEDYLKTIKKLSPYYKYFQIDFADGIYVDNRTAGLDDFINFIDLPAGRQALQSLKTLTFDFHFMVKDYENEIKKLEKLRNYLKIKNVFIHYDLFPNYQLLITNYSFPIGLVLNPQDQVGDLASKYDLNKIPCLQIMSIVPGAQGKPFISETLNKVEQLRNLGYRYEIFLDGAVNDKTLPIINSQKFKPDFICPGSFLSKTDRLKEHFDYLLQFT